MAQSQHPAKLISVRDRHRDASNAASVERIKSAAWNMANTASKTYRERGERAALRCALGDAASLLDRIATEIGYRERSRGRIRKRGLEDAALVTKCANEIAAMRDLIRVNDLGSLQAPSPTAHGTASREPEPRSQTKDQ